jgi:hypothetical protein
LSNVSGKGFGAGAATGVATEPGSVATPPDSVSNRVSTRVLPLPKIRCQKLGLVEVVSIASPFYTTNSTKALRKALRKMSALVR